MDPDWRSQRSKPEREGTKGHEADVIGFEFG